MPFIDDPLPSTPAITLAGAVRKDSAASIVDTDGDMSVLQVDASGALRVTGGGGGTEYTEDAAAPGNPVGTTVQVVRTDTPAGVASADGDFVALRGTNYGAAYTTLLDTSGNPVSVGGGTQYTEDAAAAANPVGTVPILVRQDTPASEVSANGDNIAQRANAYGAGFVQVVTSAGAFVDSFGGGTEYTEDAAAAANPVGKANILVRQDTPATLVSADGDNVAQRGTNYGAAYTQIITSSGAYVDTFGGGTQYTEGDTDATITGTAMLMEGAGNALVVAQGTAADGLLVNLGSNNDVTVTGTVTANLAAGTNNIGDVDVLSVPAPLNVTGGGVEASALRVTIASDSTGVVSVDDNGGSLTVDGTVAVSGSVAVTNAGTFVVQENGAALTALQLIDDTVATLGTTTYSEATTKGLTIGAVRRDADTTLVDTTNEIGPLQMNAAGQLKVEVFSGEALPVTMTSTTITGTVAVTQSGTWDEVGINDSGNSITVDNGGTFAVQVDGSALTSLQLLDDAVATTASAITTKGFAASGTDGTNARILKTDTSGELQIDVLTLPASTNTIEVVGDAAHDAAIAGNPVRIGGRALTSDITAVAAGDTCDLITTLLGKLVTIPFANPANTWSYAAASGGITNTTGVTIKAAAGAGVRNYITCLTVINGHASTSTDVQIRDGASGTVLWRGFAQAAGGGVREVFTVPIRGSANTLLEVACGTTGSATYVNAQGFTAAE